MKVGCVNRLAATATHSVAAMNDIRVDSLGGDNSTLNIALYRQVSSKELDKWGQTLFIEILSRSSLLQHVYHSSSFLRTSQMNPSLHSARSVIVCIRISVVPNDRLAINSLVAPHDTGGRMQRFG